MRAFVSIATADNNNNSITNHLDQRGEIMSKTQTKFHTDKGASDAATFYSDINKKRNTLADSCLYHMRAFNNFNNNNNGATEWQQQ